MGDITQQLNKYRYATTYINVCTFKISRMSIETVYIIDVSYANNLAQRMSKLID